MKIEQITENMSHTAKRIHDIEKEKGVKPGTPEWFKLWFSLPYLKESIDERELTKAEIKKRDDYADDLPDAEFKKRYGKDWEAVKYGTATNMAKGESVEEATKRDMETKGQAEKRRRRQDALAAKANAMKKKKKRDPSPFPFMNAPWMKDDDENENKVQEAFDNPYPITWEYLKPTGPSSGIVKLDDGSALDIHISEDPAGIYEIEFARGQSKKNMGRSGQGDEFRIFATVQAAMLKWWKQLDKTSVKKITFYANKEDGNRARLYKRFLTMWGDKSEWDIEVNANVKPGLVAYTLTNPSPDNPKNDKKTFMQRLFGEEQTVENFADGKVKGKSRPGRVKRSGASCDGSVTELRKKAKNSSGEKAKMYHWCANMKAGKKK